jgi:hypothetical protein
LDKGYTSDSEIYQHAEKAQNDLAKKDADSAIYTQSDEQSYVIIFFFNFFFNYWFLIIKDELKFKEKRSTFGGTI